jgi:hypothetical protein
MEIGVDRFLGVIVQVILRGSTIGLYIAMCDTASATLMLTRGMPNGYHPADSDVGLYWAARDDEHDAQGIPLRRIMGRVKASMGGEYKLKVVVLPEVISYAVNPINCEVIFGVITPNSGTPNSSVKDRPDSDGSYTFVSPAVNWGKNTVGPVLITSKCAFTNADGVLHAVKYIQKILINSPNDRDFRAFEIRDLEQF